MIDVKLLTLLKVYETGNYTRAAEQLSLTQPAVSQHIKQIEKELNITLFIRSGGKIFITFLFDSCFSWLFFVPAAFLLSRYTALPITMVYLLVLSLEIIKGLIGFYMMKRGAWVRNIISDIAL